MKGIGQVFALALSASALLTAMGVTAFASDSCSDEGDNWRNAWSFASEARVGASGDPAVTATANGDTKTLDTSYKQVGGNQGVPGRNKDEEYTTTFSISGVSGSITCTAKLKSNSDHDVKYVSNTCTSVSGYSVACQRNYESTDQEFVVKYTVNKQ